MKFVCVKLFTDCGEDDEDVMVMSVDVFDVVLLVVTALVGVKDFGYRRSN